MFDVQLRNSVESKTAMYDLIEKALNTIFLEQVAATPRRQAQDKKLQSLKLFEICAILLLLLYFSKPFLFLSILMKLIVVVRNLYHMQVADTPVNLFI